MIKEKIYNGIMADDLSKIHDCEKCHNKIVMIEIDKVGITRCGYCHEIVDYKQIGKVVIWDEINDR